MSTRLTDTRRGIAFTWGRVIKLHEIGEYCIAEYHPFKIGNKMKIEKEVLFHGWVKGENTSRSWHSLDEALAGCIAYKFEGPNHRADYYFSKMLKKG